MFRLVLGVGGAGMDMGQHLSSVLGCEFLGLNSGPGNRARHGVDRMLRVPPPVRIHDESDLFQWGTRSVLALRTAFGKELDGCSQLIVVAGLGGKTGTSLLMPVTGFAKSLGLNVLAVVTLPFPFEEARRSFAESAMTQLGSLDVAYVVYDHAVALMEAPDSDLISVLRIARKACEHLVLKELA